MSIAKLSIDLEARLASFERDMGRAAKASEDTAAQIDRAFKAATTTVTLLAGAAGLAVAALQVRGQIDLLDQLDDLREKTGIAVESLSALRFAGEATGTPFEALTGGLTKLSRQMAEAAGGNKEAAAAFAAVGVSVTDQAGKLRGADEVLADLADRFASYEDGAGKAALAQQFFGKTGADMIPILNQGSRGLSDLRDEAQKLGVVFDSEMAAKAAEFNDNLTKMDIALQGVKVTIVSQLIPGLTELSRRFVESARDSGLFLGTLKTIGQSIKEKLGLDELSQTQAALQQTGARIRTVVGEIERLQGLVDKNPRAMLEATVGRDGRPAMLATERIKELRAEYEKLTRRASDLSDKLKGGADEADGRTTFYGAGGGRGFINPGSERADAPVVGTPGTAGTPRSPAAAKLSELDRYIQQLESARTRALDLSATEQAVYDIAAGRLGKLSQAAKDRVLGIAQQIDELAAQEEAERAIAKAKDDAARATQAAREEAERLYESVLTPAERYAQTIERIKQLTEQGAFGDPQSTDTWDKVSKVQQRMQEQLQAKTDKVSDSARELGLTFSSAFEDAVVGGKRLQDVLAGVAQDLARMALRKGVTEPALNWLTSNGGTLLSSAGSWLTRMFGGFFADGGSPPVGKVSIVGERGPELFVPKSAGTIIPNHMLGGSGVSNSVAVNVTINQSGDTQSSTDAKGAGAQLGTAISAAVQQELAKQSRQGGLLWRMKVGQA